jgi:hypothetical protein
MGLIKWELTIRFKTVRVRFMARSKLLKGFALLGELGNPASKADCNKVKSLARFPK